MNNAILTTHHFQKDRAELAAYETSELELIKRNVDKEMNKLAAEKGLTGAELYTVYMFEFQGPLVKFWGEVRL